jgi:hypothetical protein
MKEIQQTTQLNTTAKGYYLYAVKQNEDNDNKSEYPGEFNTFKDKNQFR